MRTIRDSAGRIWDVSVGKESYGMLVLIFSVRDGGDVRQWRLAAGNALDAARELDALSDADLRARLADAEAWGRGPA